MNWLKHDYTTTINMPIHIPPGLLLVIVIIISYSLIPGYMNYFSGKLLRYPTILFIYTFVSIELVFYFAIRLFILLSETIIANPTHRKLRSLMTQSKSYEEWYILASQLDESQKRNKWRSNLNDFTAYHFSWTFLKELISDMKLARSQNNVSMAISILQQCSRKNVGGIMREELYSYTNTGEPKLIVHEFVDEVVTTLNWVTEKAKSNAVKERSIKSMLHDTHHPMLSTSSSSSTGTSSDSVINFLQCARTTYGKTALCLSGGGMMALYHLGTVRALFDENILPHIISGASAGALIAALACTRTDEELKRDLSAEVLQPKFTCCTRNWVERIRSYIKNGSMFDNSEWLELVEWFTCGNMTFQEAYEKSGGRILCITLSTTTKKAPPIVLNHVSAPNVVIASAVVASSCMPYILKPMNLRSKNTTTGEIEILKEEYWDGSIEQDIPTSGLAEMLNCHFFVVAQANPHVVPFVFNSDGDIGRPNRWKHSRRGGYLLSGLELYLKMDMRNKLSFLREVGAVVGFTANLFSQDFGGTTTIVPDVTLMDYFCALENPTESDMDRYFQGGAVSAYRNVALIKLHYKLARAMDNCLHSLRNNNNNHHNVPVTTSPTSVAAAAVVENLTATTKTTNIRRRGIVGAETEQEEKEEEKMDDLTGMVVGEYCITHSILRGVTTDL